MNIFSRIAAGAFGVATFVLAAAAPSQASMIDTFACEAGDMSYFVQLNPRDPSYVVVDVVVGEQMDQSLNRTFDLPAVPAASGFAYEADRVRFFGKGATAYLSSGGYIADCVFQQAGPPREPQTHAGGAVGGNEGPAINRAGRSLGGRLRNGPGTNFSPIGSLAEGTPLTIVRSTGVWFNGFDWFEVSVNGRRAYQWGGILCTEGGPMAGVFSECHGPYRSGNNAGGRGDWMIFAIDERGNVGHGRAANLAQAESYALQHCGNRQCRLAERPVRGGCHALADSQVGGYWVGIGHGDRQRQASRTAMRYCEQAAPSGTCRVRYRHCQ